MAVTVKDIIQSLDMLAPFSIAESWDNVGLLIGDRNREVRSILLGLDPTSSLLDEAIAIKADTVITHHPAIFKPLPSIDTSAPAGRFLEKALVHQINVFACHTNFDSIAPGVNDRLAELLGLQEVRPLIPCDSHPASGAGMGRIGLLHPPLKWEDFSNRLLEILELPSFQAAGPIPEFISSVALCGGSGSDFAGIARSSGADVYISAEIKHNIGIWAHEAGLCIIDGTHYATEKPAVTLLTERLRNYVYEKGWEIEITESKTEYHPFKTVDTNSYKKISTE